MAITYFLMTVPRIVTLSTRKNEQREEGLNLAKHILLIIKDITFKQEKKEQ
jgi:hypothetical protein